MTQNELYIAETSRRRVFRIGFVLLLSVLCTAGVIWYLDCDAPNLVLKTSVPSYLLQQLAETNIYSRSEKELTAEVQSKNLVSSAFLETHGVEGYSHEANQAKIYLESNAFSANGRHLLASSHDVSETGARGQSEEHQSYIQENIFHSASLFLMNYQDMLASLKVYIYPTSDDKKHDFRYQSKEANEDMQRIRATDVLLFDALAASNFVTSDPEEADLFFIPLSMSAIWADFQGDSKRIANYVKGYIQQLRNRYPYWDRTLGTDHVFVSCNDLKGDSSRNVLELKKNAIQIACSPLAANGTQDFFPHKDITLPLFEGETLESTVCKSNRGGSGDRKHTVYYGSHIEENNPLASVYESWNSPGLFLDSGGAEHSRLLSMFSSSRFCLSLGASDRAFVVDSLRCGCIPVLFSSSNFFDLPFQDVLNWHKFSLVLNSKEIGNLKKILSAIPESQLKTMESSALAAAKHMDWLPISNPFNSFHLVMYELWIRSHTIRYKQRDVK